MFLQSFKKLAKVLRMRFIKKECGDYFMKTVKETVEYRERNNIRRNDFMDLLIDLKNNKNGDNPEGLTIDEVCAHSFIFIFAGFETSSSLMGFMLYELARNPEIQSKLRNHINSTLGKHNGASLGWSNTPKMERIKCGFHTKSCIENRLTIIMERHLSISIQDP
uniref:Cytochrome P450 n=1 Tax=Megaselia scalaris TaxID=36166 RepID=T1H3Z9_MEGSC